MNLSRLIFIVVYFVFFAIHTQGQQVFIPGGQFTMGCLSGCESDEIPSHTVEISAFYIDKYEITNSQYDSCVAKGRCTPAHYNDGACLMWNGSSFKKVKVPDEFQKPQFPVACVSWRQADAFCSWKGMKLPTEAQWEYAASGVDKKTYSWGNESPSQAKCRMAGQNFSTKIGSYPPNAKGLFDMTGNVWEWVSDYYSADYYTNSPSRNPKGPEVGLYKVLRGGGWYSTANQLRIANRHWFSPDFQEISVGFRCVKDAK